jgi:hypothetical protein
MDAWLTDVRNAIADATGIPAADLEIGEDEAGELLNLARIAAHDSGERTNAPLLTYLAGVAVGRGAELHRVVARRYFRALNTRNSCSCVGSAPS